MARLGHDLCLRHAGAAALGARTSYVMAVVTPAERTAAASPALAGALFAAGHQNLPLIACGVLKILYDFALLGAFRHIRPPEER